MDFLTEFELALCIVSLIVVVASHMAKNLLHSVEKASRLKKEAGIVLQSANFEEAKKQYKRLYQYQFRPILATSLIHILAIAYLRDRPDTAIIYGFNWIWIYIGMSMILGFMYRKLIISEPEGLEGKNKNEYEY